MSSYHILPARTEEIDNLMALYDYSRGIMRRNGNQSQWTGYPTRDAILEDIRLGHSFVLHDEQGIAGVFAFIIGRDPTYEYIEDGSWEEDDRPYGTIHRLACAPDKKGIAHACFEWCRGRITSLRVDTHNDNSIMRHIMDREGFEYRGTIYIADGTARRAYQRIDSRSICEDIQRYVEHTILPRYDHYDSAHRQEHIRSVIERSMQLAQNRDTDLNMVYVIAAYHDIGLNKGRENHHLTSAEELRHDTQLPLWFSDIQLEMMAQAIEDHRASATQPPRSLYGMIVAEADRDIEPDKILRRTIQYGLAHYPELDTERQWHRFCEHLHEKYAEGGYLKLFFDDSPNAEGLRQLRTLIQEPDILRKNFDKILLQERKKTEKEA